MVKKDVYGRSQNIFSSLAVNSHPSLLQMRKKNNVDGGVKGRNNGLTQMQSNVNTFTIEPFANHSVVKSVAVVGENKKKRVIGNTSVQSDTSSNQPIL